MGIVDKARNSTRKLLGQGKAAVGKHTDNDQLKAEGLKDQAEGNVKNAVEDVKDDLDK